MTNIGTAVVLYPVAKRHSEGLAMGFLFGVYENGSSPAFLLALPEIIWEGSIGVYAAWKGFRPSAVKKTVDVREPVAEPGMAMV